MRDRNEWFKEAKGALRHLEIEAVENPFAWPTVTCVADGEDVLHALGLHPSRDVGGIVNVDESEVLELAELISPEPVTGSTSDGYHTFDELYHHRAVLFSVIVATFPGRSWKSLHHHDGTMYDGMFIVGIDTPAGPATYHYDVEPYWDMFPCEVLDRAPEWDGHTPDDAIERIGTLRDVLQAEVNEEGSSTSCMNGRTSSALKSAWFAPTARVPSMTRGITTRTMKRLCALSASARSSSRLPPYARIGRNAVSRTCPTAGLGKSPHSIYAARVWTAFATGLLVMANEPQ